MFIIVVGCGKVGYFLAQDLLSKNHELCLVEKEPQRAYRLQSELPDSVVIRGDGCDPNVLIKAGVSRADVMVACTGHDEDNLVIGHVANTLYPNIRTIACVNNPKNEAIFQSLGLDAVVNATTMLINVIEHELTVGDIVPIVTLRKTGLEVVELLLDEQSSCVGKLVDELSLPRDCVLISVVRGDHAVVPRGDTQFQAADLVIALVPASEEDHLREILAGSGPRRTGRAGAEEAEVVRPQSRRGLARLLRARG